MAAIVVLPWEPGDRQQSPFLSSKGKESWGKKTQHHKNGWDWGGISPFEAPCKV